jgi:hypothetical protein
VPAVHVGVRVDDVLEWIGAVDDGVDLPRRGKIGKQDKVITAQFRCPIVDGDAGTASGQYAAASPQRGGALSLPTVSRTTSYRSLPSLKSSTV